MGGLSCAAWQGLTRGYAGKNGKTQADGRVWPREMADCVLIIGANLPDKVLVLHTAAKFAIEGPFAQRAKAMCPSSQRARRQARRLRRHQGQKTPCLIEQKRLLPYHIFVSDL